jgi:hypothetical protein
MANLIKPFKVTALGTTTLLTCSSDKQIVITNITAQIYIPSSIGYATKTITLNLVDKSGAVYKLQEGTIGYTYNYDGDDTINIYSALRNVNQSRTRNTIMDVVVYLQDGYSPLDTYKIYLSEGDSLTASVSGYDSNLLYITYIISYYELPPSNASKTSSYQGRWVSGTYYQKNSTVFYNKDLYIAINNNTDTTSPSTTNWQIIQKSADTLNVTNLSSELTLPIGNLETTNKNTLNIAGTLTSKTLTGARFTNNQFLDSTGTYTITIPASTSDTLTTLAATQPLSNKGFTYSTVTSSTINFSDNNITYGFDGANNIIKEAVIAKTLTSGTNTISLSSTDGMVYSIQTSTTASANFTIAVPAASSYSGLILTFIVKMKAANQTLSFTTVKTARTTTASTTADTFDRYSLISDGTSWYCIQTDKGII